VIGSNSIVQLKFSGLFFGHAYLVAIEASFAEACDGRMETCERPDVVLHYRADVCRPDKKAPTYAEVQESLWLRLLSPSKKARLSTFLVFLVSRASPGIGNGVD
jgi:hypothetical protein